MFVNNVNSVHDITLSSFHSSLYESTYGMFNVNKSTFVLTKTIYLIAIDIYNIIH